MKRLILVRHAKTERRAASGEDFDRALTEEGRQAAEAMGRTLAAAGLIPQVALVSAAVRTRETFTLMAPNLPDARLEASETLYDAPAAVLRAEAAGSGADNVMVVAHNPGVHALAQALAAECLMIDVGARASLEAGFPPGTAAAFEWVDGRTACLGVFRPEGA